VRPAWILALHLLSLMAAGQRAGRQQPRVATRRPGLVEDTIMRTFFITLGLVLLVSTAGFAEQRGGPGGPPPSQAKDVGPNFVDADGDGICDLYQANGGQRRGMGLGPRDGSGRRGVGPRDGTGYGPGRGNGAGICDGTAKGRLGQGAGQRRAGR
jgi:hypothetical protein